MPDTIAITFPDGSVRQFPAGSTPADVAAAIGPGLAKAAVAAVLDGRAVDLDKPLQADATLSIITESTPEGLEVLRHSCAHIMAKAVRRLWPEAKIAIGPAIENGFYYDFDLEHSFVPDDLPRIEEEMRKIVKEDHEFRYRELTPAEAVEFFHIADEPYKIELINDLVAASPPCHSPGTSLAPPCHSPGTSLSLYAVGEFTDLCRGPHVPHVNRIKHFKLLSTAGAYWRGDETRPMLQRIYGTCFAKASELEEYLKYLEEAENRDHRRLGTELDLFSIQDDIGGGLVLWHPKGALVRKIIEDHWNAEHVEAGYDFVYTPHIGRASLWDKSGHLENYAENMYAPIDIENQQFYLKPMNCPFHIYIYKSRLRSYRDLPIRYAERGTVYRFERSGVLHGLLRVRGFTQDDAHIFCTPDQLAAEMDSILEFSLRMLRKFGFEEIKAYLSTRPDKAIGSEGPWEHSTAEVKAALDRSGLEYETDAGGGAFYGPKIDLKIKDALGRDWQLSTIQVDFNLADRFDIGFIGEDGAQHRPYMIHRALLGSLERFFGVLIEHYGGAFPLWLAPVQATVIPIADRHLDAAENVAGKLRAEGFRVRVDNSRETVNYKIRDAQMQKVPYMLIVGDKEVENGTASVRDRVAGDRGQLPVAELVAEMSGLLED